MPRTKHHSKKSSSKMWYKRKNKRIASRKWFESDNRVVDAKGNLIDHPNNVRNK
tara:strand:+ start:101 stop:262 length:162 start_codon:yes stop_codon:yes gene_type:complete